MQLTIDSAEKLDRVLQVVGSMYGVELTVVDPPATGARAAAGRRAAKAAADGSAKSPASRSRAKRDVKPRKASRASGRRRSTVEARTVRAWAHENGLEVSARGRLPEAVVAAYRQDATTSAAR